MIRNILHSAVSFKRNKILKTLLAAGLLVCLCSCAPKTAQDSGIEIQVSEQTTKDNTVIQIPEFVSSSEEVTKNLRELENKTKELRSIVEDEQKRGTHMEMRSYVSDIKNYPQVTVIWYTAIEEEDTLFYNLMTLGADEKAGLPITCKEALEMTGLTGVDLSLKVGKLAQVNNLRGELLSTEMQGFLINEEGEVEKIYMKLSMKIIQGEKETVEEHFYSYHPGTEELVRLMNEGFDIP